MEPDESILKKELREKFLRFVEEAEGLEEETIKSPDDEENTNIGLLKDLSSNYLKEFDTLQDLQGIGNLQLRIKEIDHYLNGLRSIKKLRQATIPTGVGSPIDITQIGLSFGTPGEDESLPARRQQLPTVVQPKQRDPNEVLKNILEELGYSGWSSSFLSTLVIPQFIKEHQLEISYLIKLRTLLKK